MSYALSSKRTRYDDFKVKIIYNGIISNDNLNKSIVKLKVFYMFHIVLWFSNFESFVNVTEL